MIRPVPDGSSGRGRAYFGTNDFAGPARHRFGDAEPDAARGCWPLTKNRSARRRTMRRAEEDNMGRGILLWLLGVPIPIIILLLIFWH